MTPKPWPRWIHETVAVLVVVVVGGYAFATDSPAILVFYLIGILPSVAIHEAGHYISARRHKLPVIAFCLFGVERRLYKDRWKWVKVPGFPFDAGLVKTLMPEPSNVRAYRKMVWAGPLANVLTGIVCAALSMILTDGWLRHFLLGLAVANAVMAIGSLAPHMTKLNLASDGLQLRTMQGPKAPHYLMLGTFIGYGASGKDIRELPFTWVEQVEQNATDGMELYASLLVRYSYRKAEGILDECVELLSKLEELAVKHDKSFQSNILCEAAVFHAYYRKDFETANQLLEKAKTFGEKVPGEQLTGEAIIAACLGENDIAKGRAREAMLKKRRAKVESPELLRDLSQSGLLTNAP